MLCSAAVGCCAWVSSGSGAWHSAMHALQLCAGPPRPAVSGNSAVARAPPPAAAFDNMHMEVQPPEQWQPKGTKAAAASGARGMRPAAA